MWWSLQLPSESQKWTTIPRCTSHNHFTQMSPILPQSNIGEKVQRSPLSLSTLRHTALFNYFLVEFPPWAVRNLIFDVLLTNCNRTIADTEKYESVISHEIRSIWLLAFLIQNAPTNDICFCFLVHVKAFNILHLVFGFDLQFCPLCLIFVSLQLQIMTGYTSMFGTSDVRTSKRYWCARFGFLSTVVEFESVRLILFSSPINYVIRNLDNRR